MKPGALRVEPLSPAIGAEISGMSIAALLSRLDVGTTVAEAARRFGGDPASLQTLGGGVNRVFRCDGRDGGLVLRVTHVGIRSPAQAAAGTDFLLHLAERGAPVSAPVASQEGAWRVRLEQGGDTFVTTAVRELPGAPVDSPAAPPAVFAAWGEAIALLHRAAESFQPDARHRVLHWRDDWAQVESRLPAGDAPARAEFREITERLARWPAGPGELGVTHADMNPGNALFDGRRVRLIDFDEPVFHWFASDLARPCADLHSLSPEERAERATALLSGYRSARPLAPSWDAELDGLLRMKTLGIYAWLLGTDEWSGPVLPGGERRGDYLARARRGFPPIAAR